MWSGESSIYRKKENFESHLSNQELVSGIYKVLLQLSNKMAWLEGAKVWEECSDGACLGAPPAMKQRGKKNLRGKHEDQTNNTQPIATRGDAQHCQPARRCRLKSHRDTASYALRLYLEVRN